MKIKNISNQTLSIPFKSKEGKGVIVSINPGQIVFCEEHSKGNKQIVIFLRKNKIEISEDDKPVNAQYYHAYGVLSHEEVLKLKQTASHTLNVETDDDSDVEDNESVSINESALPDLEIEEDDNDDSDDEDSETTQVKNKGGRPKGSKNKKKSGRPKKKKPIGRPKKKNKKSE